MRLIIGIILLIIYSTIYYTDRLVLAIVPTSTMTPFRKWVNDLSKIISSFIRVVITVVLWVVIR